MSVLKTVRNRLKLLASVLFDNGTRLSKIFGAISNYEDIMGNSNFMDLARVLKLDKEKLVNLAALGFEGFSRHDYLESSKELSACWMSEPEVARFLGEIAFCLNPGITVEVGCFVGYTSSHIARALSVLGNGGKLILIDVEERFLDIARDNISKLGLNVNLETVLIREVSDYSKVALPKKIDLIFIDSDHRRQVLLNELRFFMPLLNTGGIVVLHDTIKLATMRKAVQDLLNGYKVFTTATSRGNGLTVITK